MMNPLRALLTAAAFATGAESPAADGRALRGREVQALNGPLVYLNSVQGPGYSLGEWPTNYMAPVDPGKTDRMQPYTLFVTFPQNTGFTGGEREGVAAGAEQALRNFSGSYPLPPTTAYDFNQVLEASRLVVSVSMNGISYALRNMGRQFGFPVPDFFNQTAKVIEDYAATVIVPSPSSASSPTSLPSTTVSAVSTRRPSPTPSRVGKPSGGSLAVTEAVVAFGFAAATAVAATVVCRRGNPQSRAG